MRKIDRREDRSVLFSCDCKIIREMNYLRRWNTSIGTTWNQHPCLNSSKLIDSNWPPIFSTKEEIDHPSLDGGGGVGRPHPCLDTWLGSPWLFHLALGDCAITLPGQSDSGETNERNTDSRREKETAAKFYMDGYGQGKEKLSRRGRRFALERHRERERERNKLAARRSDFQLGEDFFLR